MTKKLHSSMLEATASLVDAGAVKVLSLDVTNTSATDGYIQLFDAEATPVAGQRPIMCFPVYALAGNTEKNESNTFGQGGIEFGVGLAWAFSSTPGTFTPTAQPVALVHIIYI